MTASPRRGGAPGGGPPERATPFTAVLCGADACALDGDHLRRRLRQTMRACPHGVLVVSPCPVGPIACRSLRHATGGTVEGAAATGTAGGGAFVLVQPCDQDRRPVVPLIAVGPIIDRADGDELSRWLRTGELNPAGLPDRLRADKSMRRLARTN